ncbi:GntR family transcriptional regulator [Candidatus Halocynthiibacter alkanivorans]|uniref:GntR family transcriptional regulator n=1 Tax=Candidatus Halocynthiibacter alkanivorans TaxID=2267619 RepID=UPI000DF29C98|nr:GntR family transcriptional regulator [Candidatus Halocynthiibacter alkanivorans]
MTRSPVAKKTTRYQEIKTALQQEIADGLHRPGQCLPTEHALCDRFSASRFTIRKAISGLREIGLVEARSGVGTIVISNQPQSRITQTLTSFEELLQYPAETFRKQLETENITATAELAAMLQCARGQPWVWLQAMRLTRHSEAPLSWLDAYILPAFANVLDLPNPTGASLLKQIEQTHDQHAALARVEVFVTRIDQKRSAQLGVPQDAPALGIIRRYSNAKGEIYLVTCSIHPENRFRLNFELERQS